MNLQRPQTFSAYLGQERIKGRIAKAVSGAKQRKMALDHMLLSGPPGLGKTTLAQIVASEMGTQFHSVNGAAVDGIMDIAGHLLKLRYDDVIFVDEIHRIPKQVMEFLYLAMEDRLIDVPIPVGYMSRYELPTFTLIGATTHAGMLAAPMLSRFSIHEKLDYYTAAELASIASTSAIQLGYVLTSDAALEIGKRSRGTPRIANNLVKRVRDNYTLTGVVTQDCESVKAELDSLGIDDAGLNETDRLILSTMLNRFSGGPCGLQAIASACGEAVETIETVVEPYLLKEGFMDRTPRGRKLTTKAVEWMKKYEGICIL